MPHREMTRNAIIFLFTEAVLAASGGFILPIYVLYFRYYHVTLFQIALLAAVFEASILIFEIPTGLFADRFGRKLSVGIGFALFTVSGLVFILYRQIEGFIIAEIIFGLSEAFISGAGEALAVDSLDSGQKDILLKKMYIVRSRLRIVLTAMFMLAAGYLFARNESVTFYPVFIGGVVGLVASFGFISRISPEEIEEKTQFFEPVRSMFAQLRVSSILRVIFIISLVANFSFEGADQYWQVLGTEMFDLDVNYFGLLTASGAILAFILVGQVVNRTKPGLAVVLVFLLLSGVIISSMPNSPEMLLPYLLILYFFTREIIRPLLSVEMNRLIKSEGRATFLSSYNLTCSIGEVASGIMVGLIASRLGLPFVFIVCGSILVVITVVAMFRRAGQ